MCQNRLRLSPFKNCDKGLVFLFVRVLETQSLGFNRGHTCGKELVLRRVFSLLPPTSACSFLVTKQSTGAEEDLRAEDQEGRCVTKRVPPIDRPAVGRASRCSSSRNVPYAGHRHPHRAEEDLPCSQGPWLTELHRRPGLTGWPAAAITRTAEKVGTQTSSKGKKSPERPSWFRSILSRNRS